MLSAFLSVTNEYKEICSNVTMYVVNFFFIRSGLCKLWSIPDCEPIAVLRGIILLFHMLQIRSMLSLFLLCYS